MRISIAITVCAALTVGACQTSPTAPGAPARPAAGVSNAVFDYLLARYDADGDGVITLAEYDRPGADYMRLDRDGDGVVGASDFERAGRRVAGLSPADARWMRALHLLGWYFQDEGPRNEVTAGELATALAAYDANGDGRVGRTEFELAAEERARLGRRPAGEWSGLLEVETTDPWEEIGRGVDTNDDGFVTARELGDFHTAHAGEWTFAEHDVVASRGPIEGQLAPDFTLTTTDGEGEVTLSEYAGDRPVALVFGSYT